MREKKRMLGYYLHVFLITSFAMFTFKETDFIVPQSFKFIWLLAVNGKVISQLTAIVKYCSFFNRLVLGNTCE